MKPIIYFGKCKQDYFWYPYDCASDQENDMKSTDARLNILGQIKGNKSLNRGLVQKNTHLLYLDKRK